MKLNEEQLIDDLTNQQNMSRDAIRSMENLAKQFEEERERIKRDVQNQCQQYAQKEAKIWNYKVEALKTVNETLTKRIQGYEGQEQLLIELERKNDELEEEILKYKEDLDRIRSERKAYKEENHTLLK